MKKEAWFSIDVETNGAVPGLYDLVSIGACVIERGNKSAFYDVVAPHGGLVDPEAQAVHKITEEERALTGVSPALAIRRFVEFVEVEARGLRPVFCS